MQGVPVTLLWQYIFMPHGLEQWFADEVRQDGKTFTFIWDGVPQQAALVSVRSGVYARFHWTAASALSLKCAFSSRNSPTTRRSRLPILPTRLATCLKAKTCGTSR